MGSRFLKLASVVCCVLVFGCVEDDEPAPVLCPAGSAVLDLFQCVCQGSSNGLAQCQADGTLTGCDCSPAAQQAAFDMNAPADPTTGQMDLAQMGQTGSTATPACLAAVDATGQSADCGQCLCENCDEAVITACDAMCWGLISCIGACQAETGADTTTCATGQCVEFIDGATAATPVGECAFTASGDICTARCASDTPPPTAGMGALPMADAGAMPAPDAGAMAAPDAGAMAAPDASM
ncbi:MAG: hypothetical protein OXT09_15110 [Myxococcales bacterium]|nr:hypothetical protein [Myxococcales bacterium]